MDRRAFIVSATAFALSRGVEAQAKVYRLGILHAGTGVDTDPDLTNWIATPLAQLGYVEGSNLVVVRRYAQGKFERLPAMAQDLVKSRPDVILAVGTVATQAAKGATTTIPIVLLTNSDPVALGLVASLAKPGANVTGVLISPEGSLAAKKLELLRETVPRATRIALLLADDPGAGTGQQLREVQQAAATLGVELVVATVRGGDYGAAFATMAAGRPAALFVGAHSFFIRDRKSIIDFAATHRLPAIYEWPLFVKAGGLMSYGASDVETYRQVAVYIDRILKGANPGDVPIWQPSKLYLVINVGTAKAIGLTIPPAIMVRADELIQ